MSEASPKKKRSPAERLVVWGLIAVLLVVVLIEFRASTNFNAAQEYLSDAVERHPTPTIDEVKSKISGASVGPKETDKLGTDEYEFAFFSLFKSDTYKLRVQLLELPSDGPQPAEGERRIVEVYVPAIAEEVRKEHEDFIVNTPHDLPDADDGTGSGDVGAEHGAEYGGESNSESQPEPESTSPEGGEQESPSEPAGDQTPPDED